MSRTPADARSRACGAAATSRRAADAVHREYVAASIRKEILEAALRAFTRHGHGNTTIRDIAGEAGYTAGALYVYFENKDAIIVGILEMMLAGVLEVFERPVGRDQTFDEKLEHLLGELLGQADQQRDGFRLVMALQADPKSLPEGVSERLQPGKQWEIHERLAGWLSKNARPTDLGRERPEDVAALLLGMASGLAMQGLQGQDPPRQSLASQAPRVVRVLLHGIHGKPSRQERARATPRT